MRSNGRIAGSLLVVAALLIAGPAMANTMSTWSAAGDGQWGDGNNWSTSPTVPDNNGTKYDVVIDDDGGTNDVTVQIGDAAGNPGDFEVSNLTIDDGDELFIRDFSFLTIDTDTGGTVNVNGTLTLEHSGPGSEFGTLDRVESGTLLLTGAGEIKGTKDNGKIAFGSDVGKNIIDTDVTVTGGITLKGSFTNRGTLTDTNRVLDLLPNAVRNEGVIEASANNGPVNLRKGTVTNDTTSGGGLLRTVSGGELAIGGQGNVSVTGGSVDNQGTLALNTKDNPRMTHTFDGVDVDSAANAAILVNGSRPGNPDSGPTGTIWSLVNATTVDSAGSMSVDAEAVVRIDETSTLSILPNGTLTVDDGANDEDGIGGLIDVTIDDAAPLGEWRISWAGDNTATLDGWLGDGRLTYTFGGSETIGTWYDVGQDTTFFGVVVPEPATLALLSLGMLGLRRRRC